jgi:hypothetical protein
MQTLASLICIWTANGEVEGPHRSVLSAPRVHTVSFRRPRRETIHASQPCERWLDIAQAKFSKGCTCESILEHSLSLRCF